MTTHKLLLSWEDVEHQCQTIVQQMQIDRWIPDLIIGIDRGGLVASSMISHYLKVPHQSVKVSLRENGGEGTQSLLWAPEDVIEGSRILIVDDINDTGATQAWLRADWASSVAGVEPHFDAVHWHNNVRWASLVENDASDEYSDYHGMVINKLEHDLWVDFPWESWWNRSTK